MDTAEITDDDLRSALSMRSIAWPQSLWRTPLARITDLDPWTVLRQQAARLSAPLPVDEQPDAVRLMQLALVEVCGHTRHRPVEFYTTVEGEQPYGLCGCGSRRWLMEVC